MICSTIGNDSLEYPKQPAAGFKAMHREWSASSVDAVVE